MEIQGAWNELHLVGWWSTVASDFYFRARDFFALHWKRFSRFFITGVGGFLVSEIIIVVGLRAFTLSLTLPVIVTAGIVSVTFGFFVNERWTMKDSEVERTALPTLTRLGKFQAVYLLGNIVSWAVQLSLLHIFGLNPGYGNIPGSAAALPVNYFVSSKLVWKLKLL